MCRGHYEAWDSSITLSAQEMADVQKAFDLARYEPLPDPDEDDFADEPLPKPYDPESATVPDWAKPEAWIQEKDTEGNSNTRTSFSIINFYQDEQYGAIKLQRWSDARDQRAW